MTSGRFLLIFSEVTLRPNVSYVDHFYKRKTETSILKRKSVYWLSDPSSACQSYGLNEKKSFLLSRMDLIMVASRLRKLSPTRGKRENSRKEQWNSILLGSRATRQDTSINDFYQYSDAAYWNRHNFIKRNYTTINLSSF